MEDSHHFIGTKLDNARDMAAKGRRVDHVGELHGNAKLSDHKVQVARFLDSNTTLTQKEIGRLFGVEADTISCVARGRAWSHVARLELGGAP